MAGLLTTGTAMHYHVYFRRPDDCVVYAAATQDHEVSLVHRMADGRWDCALCRATDCRHATVALRASEKAVNGDRTGDDWLFTIPLPNG